MNAEREISELQRMSISSLSLSRRKKHPRMRDSYTRTFPIHIIPSYHLQFLYLIIELLPSYPFPSNPLNPCIPTPHPLISPTANPPLTGNVPPSDQPTAPPPQLVYPPRPSPCSCFFSHGQPRTQRTHPPPPRHLPESLDSHGYRTNPCRDRGAGAGGEGCGIVL